MGRAYGGALPIRGMRDSEQYRFKSIQFYGVFPLLNDLSENSVQSLGKIGLWIGGGGCWGTGGLFFLAGGGYYSG